MALRWLLSARSARAADGRAGGQKVTLARLEQVVVLFASHTW